MDWENMDINELSRIVIGAAIEVHRQLGPGLLESAYEHCLAHELGLQGVPYEQQKPCGVNYKGEQLDAGYRLDLLVADRIIVELKAVSALEPIHTAQALTYLKLTDKKLALLINFNVKLLKNGIKRIVYKL